MTGLFNDALVYLPRTNSYNEYQLYFENKKQNAGCKKKVLQKNGSAENVTKYTQITRGASFVVGQKLRESKWFTHEEMRVFLAVVETGFIVETEGEVYGVAAWLPGHEKSKDQSNIEIYTVRQSGKHLKVTVCKLLDFWTQDRKLRINNHSDRDNSPHDEEIIRDQLAYAMNNKRKWHNSHHFSYWCRYGPPQVNYRMKQVSDSVKWGNIGINTGLLLLRNRKKSNSK